MKGPLSTFVTGFIFAWGLGISGMTNPDKVRAFLDISGKWDPSLTFVMLGAIGIHFIIYQLVKKRPSPLFSTDWHIPTNRTITPSLFIGSALFGVGWGLSGLCPGPALTSFATFDSGILIFLFAMLLGMYLFKKIDQKLKLTR